jgi:hypothetical protein
VSLFLRHPTVTENVEPLAAAVLRVSSSSSDGDKGFGGVNMRRLLLKMRHTYPTCPVTAIALACSSLSSGSQRSFAENLLRGHLPAVSFSGAVVPTVPSSPSAIPVFVGWSTLAFLCVERGDFKECTELLKTALQGFNIFKIDRPFDSRLQDSEYIMRALSFSFLVQLKALRKHSLTYPLRQVFY